MATRFVTPVKSDGAAFNALADQIAAVGAVAAFTSNAAASPLTLTAAQVLAGVFIQTTAGAFTLNTPTAAALVAAIPNCQVGSQAVLFIRNDGSGTLTVAAGSGVTLSGTATQATTLGQIWIFKVTNATVGAEAVTAFAALKVAA
jgi:hypothetical protein